MNTKRKPLYPDTGSVKPEARKSYVTWVNAEKPVRKVWAVGRFLRDMKVWALSGGEK